MQTKQEVMGKFKMTGFPKHGEITKSPIEMGAYTGDFGYDDSGKRKDQMAAQKTIGASAAQGAAMGAKYGPWGAAAGAVVGGTIGAFGAKEAEKEADRVRKEQIEAENEAIASNEIEAQYSNYNKIKNTRGVGSTNLKDVQVEDKEIETNKGNTASKLAEKYT